MQEKEETLCACNLLSQVNLMINTNTRIKRPPLRLGFIALSKYICIVRNHVYSKELTALQKRNIIIPFLATKKEGEGSSQYVDYRGGHHLSMPFGIALQQ